ncbi:Tn3 family transposase [Endozoicomonas lisbonensis]|uniref:Tn3 transposase DDE domain-containing protein n=1 Tax=Endozoicomonas lisbonensis TaxID=3120522 RepID=A0ABV2SB32_9GAMM
MFVGDRIGMWDSFTHMKDRYTKRKNPLPLVINACLLSEAFGFGALKMADMSDLELNQLRSIREDFVRVDTLCEANDIVSNHIHSLPIFKQWNLMSEKVLADTDGQKFTTTDSTIRGLAIKSGKCSHITHKILILKLNTLLWTQLGLLNN